MRKYNVSNNQFEDLINYFSLQFKYEDLLKISKYSKVVKYINSFLNYNKDARENLYKLKNIDISENSNLLSLYNVLSDLNYINSEEEFINIFKLVKDRDLLFRKIVDSFADVNISDYLNSSIALKKRYFSREDIQSLSKKRQKNSLYEDGAKDKVVSELLNAFDYEISLIEKTVVSINNTNTVSLATPVGDEEDSSLGDFIPDAKSDFTRSFENTQTVLDIEELATSILLKDPISKSLSEEDRNTVLEFGKAYARYIAAISDEDKQKCYSVLLERNYDINRLNACIELQEIILDMKEKYQKRLNSIFRLNNVPEDRINHFYKVVDKKIDFNKIIKEKGPNLDFGELRKEYVNTIIIAGQGERVLKREDLITLTRMYQVDTLGNDFKLKTAKNTIEDNINIYGGTNSAISNLRKRDVFLKRWRTDADFDDYTLELLGAEYGVTRERIRQIEAQVKRSIMPVLKREGYEFSEDKELVVNGKK